MVRPAERRKASAAPDPHYMSVSMVLRPRNRPPRGGRFRVILFSPSTEEAELSAKHIAFLVEVPAIYTADIDELRVVEGDFDSESDFLSNCMGEPGVVRLRTEISGEKDSEIVEVWGHIREVLLVEPSRGYGGNPKLADEQLEQEGWNLLRDEGCEWCQDYHGDLR